MGSLAAIVVVYTDLTHWLHDVDGACSKGSSRTSSLDVLGER